MTSGLKIQINKAECGNQFIVDQGRLLNFKNE